jgi:hypothetical protein
MGNCIGMYFRTKGFFLLLLLSVSTFSLLSKELDWVKVKTVKGVSVYKAEVKGRVAFRGVGKMKGKPETLISIIENPAGWKNWIENIKFGKLIEAVSPTHKIFYQAIRSPFPVSDRDVVYESKIFRDNPESFRIEMKSVLHPKAPKSIGVRINILFTRYHIEKIDDNTMDVTFETLSDPGGTLPGFMVNWASANYPITLFEGLRRELNTLQKTQAKK